MNKKQLQGLFAQQTIAQQYKLDGYSQEELVKMYMALDAAQKTILRKWGAATEWSQLRALGLVEEAKAVMDAIKPKVGESLAAMLGKASASSSRAYSNMLSLGGKAKGVVPAFLSSEQMQGYWQQTPVGGRLLQEWINKTFDGPTLDAIRRQVFAGMFEGLGFAEMTKELQYGFLSAKHQAETLVSTYVQTANVHAMDTVYKANQDVLVGVRWLTAFDKRTCLKCAALSGKLYPVNEHPPCPCHPRCRCVLIPETDFGKLKARPQVAEDWAKGLKTPMPDALKTVLTPDGIPKTDFRRWIMAQPEKAQRSFFGPNRFDMLKKRQIGWDDLVDLDNLRIRTLPELRGDASLLAAMKRGDAEAAAKLASKLQNRLVKQALHDAALTNAVDAAATAKKARQEAKKAAEAAKKKHGEAVKAGAGIAKKKAAIERIIHKKARGERLTAEEAKLAQSLSPKQKAAMYRAVKKEAARLGVVRGKPESRPAGPGGAKSARRPEPRLTPEEKAVLAQIEDPREVVTFTKGGAVPPQYNKPVAKPDLEQKEVWAPPLKSKGGKPISTGAIVIDEATAKVFLVKPKGGYGGYEYTYPKGKIAKGLTAQQNAIKEVWEEAGLDVELLDYLGGYEKTTSTTHYFVARLKGGSPAAFLDETEAVVLAPMNRLKGLVNTAVDKQVVKDFIERVAAAKAQSRGDLAGGFRALNEKSKMDAAYKAIKVKEAKKIAADIRETMDKMLSGAPAAPKTEKEIFAAISKSAITPMQKDKLKKVAANMAAQVEAKKEAAKKAAEAAEKAAKEAAEKAAKEAAEKAAKAEAEKTLDGKNLVWSRAKEGGSNKAAYYKDKKTGVEYYVKFLGDDAKIDNEILASKLYREAGVNVPELKAVIMPNGERALASRVVPGIAKNEAELIKPGSAMNKAAKLDMGVDAWLANWDVVGLEYDNLVVDAAGKVYRIDVGGSLLYRAQGLEKGKAFGKAVTELETFFTKNPKAAEVFANITEKEIVDGVKRVAAIPEERIRELVTAYGPGDAKQKKALADKLVARRKDLMNKYKIAEPKPDSAKVRYGKADNAFADDVNRLGAQGKSIPTDAGDIEDQNVLVFTQKGLDGEPQTVIKMKLRPGKADKKLKKTLGGMTPETMEEKGIKSVATEEVKCTKRITEDGICKVTEDNVPLHKMYANDYLMNSYPGQQYVVQYEGARMRYIPHGSDPHLYAFHGELEITIQGKASAKNINDALENLGKLGVDTTPATAANSELMYLDKAAYIRKVHLDDDWVEMVKNTKGLSLQEQIEERARMLSVKMGVTDVRKLPDYKPDGEYQKGILSGSKDAGQRLQYRFDLTQEMLNAEMEHYYLMHEFWGKPMTADNLRPILLGNKTMSSTVEKVRNGIPASGASPVKDTKKGGACYFFTRIADMKNKIWHTAAWDGRIVFKKDLLRRADAISYTGDKYGETLGTHVQDYRRSDIHGFKQCATKSDNETNFKHGVTLLDNVEVITTATKQQADEIIDMFVNEFGITHLPDGRAIQTVVMTGGEWIAKMQF